MDTDKGQRRRRKRQKRKARKAADTIRRQHVQAWDRLLHQADHKS